MADLKTQVEKALDGFVESARVFAGLQIPRSALEYEVLPPPHRPGRLPPGKRAVIAFYWPKEERFLLVGLVGPNSEPRFISQHYRPSSARAGLAHRLVAHQRMLGLSGLTPATVGPWMKANLARINIFLPANMEDEARLLRDYLVERWDPVFRPGARF